MHRAPSYRQALADAIRQGLPAPFFARWPLRRGPPWTPQRISWVALLMAWSAEQTLADRFEAAGGLLAALFPLWRLGGTYTGWSAALGAWPDTLAGGRGRAAAAADEGLRRPPLAPRRLVRLRLRRLAGGVPAGGGQRGGPGPG